MRKKLWLATSLALLVAGCQSSATPEEISVASSNVASQSEESVEEETFVDKRFVPEFNQVEVALQELDTLTLGEHYFELGAALKQEQQAFDVVIEKMKVYEVARADKEWQGEFAFETKPGAVIVMHAAITNYSSAPMYFPIEELRLSFDDAMSKVAPSTQLYPLESGNLAEILLENNGAIAPSATVDGYLVYGVGSTSWQKMKSLDNFYLTVVPPRASLTELIGAGANKLGEIQDFFLPLNLRVERQLSENEQFIQDRLTTEWWGTKHILAEATLLNQTQRQDDVTVKLKRIEVADFEPRMKYEEAFQNFTFGQVIVSIAYEVTNHGETILLPIDTEAQLLIGDDEIHSDYVLTNQTYGHEVDTGETYTVIKTFALDKKRYQMLWQDQLMKFVLPIPLELDGIASKDAESSSDTNAQPTPIQPKKAEVIVEFEWQPRLTQWIDEALKRTANSANSMDDSSNDISSVGSEASTNE